MTITWTSYYNGDMTTWTGTTEFYESSVGQWATFTSQVNDEQQDFPVNWNYYDGGGSSDGTPLIRFGGRPFPNPMVIAALFHPTANAAAPELAAWKYKGDWKAWWVTSVTQCLPSQGVAVALYGLGPEMFPAFAAMCTGFMIADAFTYVWYWCSSCG